MLMRKSGGGVAGRVADLRLDATAKAAALAVRAADKGGGEAAVRFLGRFLDHLHDAANAAHGLAPPDCGPRSARRRPRPD